VRGGAVDIYPGGFRDYVLSHAPKVEEPPRPQKKKSEAPPPRDEERAKKAAFEAQRLAARGQEKRKRRIEELEKAIADGDKELGAMRAKLKEDPGGDWAKIAELASREQALAKRVDLMMGEWAKLSMEHE
jgi:ATP-binding cassette subfamily F protein 3